MNFTKKRPKERQRARARDGEQEAVSNRSLPTPQKKIQKKFRTTHNPSPARWRASKRHRLTKG